jgi:hypothetical protein
VQLSGYGLNRTGFGRKCSDRHNSPPSLLVNGWRSVKLTIRVLLLPRFRMSGAIPPHHSCNFVTRTIFLPLPLLSLMKTGKNRNGTDWYRNWVIIFRYLQYHAKGIRASPPPPVSSYLQWITDRAITLPHSLASSSCRPIHCVSTSCNSLPRLCRTYRYVQVYLCTQAHTYIFM